MSCADLPMALIDRELCESVETRIVVALDHQPRRCVRDAEIDHLAVLNHMMQAVHELRNAGREVPPVHIKQVDVVRLQLLQTRLDRDSQALGVVALEVGFDLFVGADGSVAGGEFGSEDHFVAVLALLQPFADPCLAFLALVVVGGVNEVTTIVVEEVEHGEGGLLCAFSQSLFPVLTKIHRTET